jgi:hypothetical protein
MPNVEKRLVLKWTMKERDYYLRLLQAIERMHPDAVEDAKKALREEDEYEQSICSKRHVPTP